ncbi:MAG: pyruvate ferredoxin oxidoreductase [Desulfarculaceae bacterium]|jgi:pyruvate/2-oxoacid:ferredoxin oxidoreductase alpha subunit
MKKLMMGTEAVAEAAKLARVQVVSAYPITPQTVIVETLAEIIGKGELKACYLNVESEHSAMAACIGASAAGARVFTATSSQGLALMHEVLHYAAGARTPVVMANANRALTPPWNLYCDHTDSLAQRDTGWLQYYCQDAQDVLDSILIAYKVAEKVLLPVMVNLDAFYLTHTTEAVELPDQKEVDSFLAPYRPTHKLDVDNPRTFGNVCGADLYTPIKFRRQKETLGAAQAWQEASDQFGKKFGRKRPVLESYRLEGASLALVVLGTAFGAVRLAVDALREKGVKAGGLRIGLLRPVPYEELCTALAGVKNIVALDRDISLGAEGVLAQEIKAALYGQPGKKKITGLILGVGGRDVTPGLVAELTKQALKGRIKADVAGRTQWVEVMQ